MSVVGVNAPEPSRNVSRRGYSPSKRLHREHAERAEPANWLSSRRTCGAGLAQGSARARCRLSTRWLSSAALDGPHVVDDRSAPRFSSPSTWRTRSGRSQGVERFARRDRHARPVEQRLRELRRVRMPSGERNSETSGNSRTRPPASRRRSAARRPASRRAGRGGGGTRRACRSRSPAARSAPATTAFCVIEQTFDVEWLCSALQAATTAAGAERPAAPPAGHRVGLRRRPAQHGAIAQSRASTPGRLCGAGS